MSVSYEDVFEQELISGLKNKFHIDDTRRLLIYLITRYHLINNKIQKIEIELFMRYLLEELAVDENMSDSAGVIFNYGGQQLITYGYNHENSLSNVYDSIMCDLYIKPVSDPNGAPMKVDEYIRTVYEKITKDAKLKVKPYKDSVYKDSILTLFKLQGLNSWYGIPTPDEIPSIPFFYQDETQMQAIDTLYLRYLHAENFDTTNVKTLTESQVRDYLYTRLELIEPGLRPIAKEYPTSEGRADIVARDIHDNIVVIEIKTENDKRLVWQCMYYPEEIGKRIETGTHVRMLTVVPDYPDYIMRPLKKLGYVESFTYKIRATNGKIENMTLTKVGSDINENLRVIAQNTRKSIDALIDSFVYTKSRLQVELEDEVDVEDICEIATDLVRIHYSNVVNQLDSEELES